ncbi:precorrin-2 dehydrogenase/sirohydrochlorin ferrochelatase family protein [Desulforhopalus singaporensis]|uniref:precorrin-2 dehydrogenase n=1 Tax=Desulforhopalus singaporensis TaxID=91360 RepID=A0A1H0NCB6_9BACT|nr:bifunctional precorrin-2 dehydrogenase/sirohydrochlorin ferrochelatase [Desulforhopalus singaporensis]SDO90327.1 precorrin-2 dehydrogenase [Desulforhopalus singaporensis]
MHLYPINLNLVDILCVIVGGGNVALRKARALIEAGARVRVISPEVVGQIESLAEKKQLEWFSRKFADGDLKGAFMVYAATDNREVQATVAKQAAASGALLNSADDPEGSHFHVPAHFRRGEILVTVSTGGGSPALARKLRESLETVISPEYEGVLDLLAWIRTEVLRVGGESERNREIFRALLDQGLVSLVLEAKWFDLQMLLVRVLPDEIDSSQFLKKFLEKYDSFENMQDPLP